MCSLCQRATPRRVSTTDGRIVIDGKPQRPFQPPLWNRNGPPRRGKRGSRAQGSPTDDGDDDLE